MGNYSYDDNRCRVDFFKPSGKWYTTEEVLFRDSDYYGTIIHTALENALKDAKLTHMLKEFDAICLEPYHEHEHPIMLRRNNEKDKAST